MKSPTTMMAVLPTLCWALSACQIYEPEALIEPEPILEEPAPVIAPSPVGRAARPQSGDLSAGDIDDTLNLPAFLRYSSRTSELYGLPKADLSNPLRLQFTGPSGRAAAGVQITLRNVGAVEPFYEGVSGVSGKVAVFPDIYGAQNGPVELRAFQNGREVLRQTMDRKATEQPVALPMEADWRPDFLDLVFAIDTSSSMDDEIAWLQRDFASFVEVARNAAPGIDLRFGLIAYQSPGDPYVLKSFGFTKRPGQMKSWLRGLEATGGAGGPEVSDQALQAAAEFPWRRGRGERLVFLIGDEPPGTGQPFIAASEAAARKGVQVFGLGASDIEGDMEFLMRQASAATGGRYLFLTDDSGVGRAHGEPDIPCYRVTSLSSLLSRVLRSELTGNRHEPAPNAVIRTVGNYHKGYCSE